MKTQDLFKINRQARRLNESLEKTFGKRLNLENFDLQQLQDARNKIRTQLSQVRSESGFNENLENDAYHQAHFMLDALNAEIDEREEIVADSSTAEIDEESADEQVDEKAPPGAKAERMVKHVKQGYADDGKLTDKEKGIAYATAWKQHNKDKNESVETGDNMTKLREGEIQQASAIVTAKTMVDRVGRWIEELSGMENDTLLTLGDSIRDEMGQEQAKAFISAVAPAIQQALENLKATRETLSTGMRTLTGEQQPAEMLGGDPAAEEPAMDIAEPDLMNAGDDLDALGDEDDFAAAEPAAGPGEAGRAQRESINFQNRLMKVLAG